MSYFWTIIAVVILIGAPFIRINRKISTILAGITVFPALYFSFFIQYYYKDYEGNFAGLILLAGYMGLIIIGENFKKYLTDWDKSEYRFWITIVVTAGSILGISRMVFYGARVYAVAFILFLVIVLMPKKFIGNNIIYTIACVGMAFGSVAIYKLSHGAHKGLYELRSRLGIVVFVVVAIAIVFALRNSRDYVSKYYLSKVSFGAICALLFTSFFDEYVLAFPFLAYYIVFCLMCRCESDENYIPFSIKDYFAELKSSYFSRVKLAAIVILPMAIEYLLLGPIEIYSANKDGFRFEYTQFVGWSFLSTIVVIIVGAVILALLTNDIFRFTISCISIAGLLSYIQYMFMNVKLVSKDGGRLDFSELSGYIKLNTAIWIIVFVVVMLLLYFLKDNWKTIVFGESLFISAVQLVAIVTLMIGIVTSPTNTVRYQFNNDDQLTVATDENIIFLIIDSFSRDDVAALLEKYPDALDEWNDFTYYDETDSIHDCTNPSVPHMLTGYDFYSEEWNSDGGVEWDARAWNSDRFKEFISEIKGAGYKFNMYTGDGYDILGPYYALEPAFDNIEPANDYAATKGLMKLLNKMSTYRYVPYILKRRFEVLTSEFDALLEYGPRRARYLNDEMYRSICENGLSIGDYDKVIKIEHSFGMHTPMRYNEYCEDISPAESNAADCAKGNSLYINKYLSELKRLGVYDNATIFIMSDHGHAARNAVFMAKKPGETHEIMQVSHVPFTYSDMQATIIDTIFKNGGGKYGKSLWEY